MPARHKKYIISVIGPTAIGKTSLAIALAQHFNTEIISADSRQFYKEMNIGTAVPSAQELAAAPHHFIQHISIKKPYSVGDFEREAMHKVQQLFQKHDMLILVGGSGLYTKSLLEGLDHFPQVPQRIRQNLNRELNEKGLEFMQNRLLEVDPVSYKNIEIQNPHRLLRALEISLGTGKAFSSFLNKKKQQRNFSSLSVGLSASREKIYQRINQRVDVMLENGLLQEAKNLYTQRQLNALNTVGYKELFRYFENDINLETAISEIKKNSRRFAKRQLTWFRKDKNTHWFNYDSTPKEIIELIENKITKNP